MSDAVIVVVPAATAVTVNVALNEPAGTVTGVCTVATDGLLLDSGIVAPPGATSVRVTVPCPLPPAGMLVAFSVTLATPTVVGTVGEPEPPHRLTATAATAVIASMTNGVGRRVTIIGSFLS